MRPPKALLHLNEIEKDRFWSRVDVRGPDDCWPWAALKNPVGYGLIDFNQEFYFAHRIAFWLFKGLDPTRRPVHHNCGNVGCCNPKHMYIGDYQFPEVDEVDEGAE